MLRKLQVYEAALTEALPDGKISERKRELLVRGLKIIEEKGPPTISIVRPHY